jgi:hypothetical protein
MVHSNGRNNSHFGAPAALPALFLVSEGDACPATSPSVNVQIFDKVKRSNSKPTELVMVKGGDPDGDPCTTGVHMYRNAHDEVAKAIDDFIARTLALPR